MKDVRQFTSREVVHMTGITPRQLQWWDERGIVIPARAAHKRLYSTSDLLDVAVICELRRKGFSLQRVRTVMSFLKRDFARRLAQTVSVGSDVHLLTDGESIYLETSPTQIVDILKNSQQPMLAICLSDTLRRVEAVIRGTRKSMASVPAAATRGRGKAS